MEQERGIFESALCAAARNQQRGLVAVQHHSPGWADRVGLLHVHTFLRVYLRQVSQYMRCMAAVVAEAEESARKSTSLRFAANTHKATTRQSHASLKLACLQATIGCRQATACRLKEARCAAWQGCNRSSAARREVGLDRCRAIYRCELHSARVTTMQREHLAVRNPRTCKRTCTRGVGHSRQSWVFASRCSLVAETASASN